MNAAKWRILDDAAVAAIQNSTSGEELRGAASPMVVPFGPMGGETVWQIGVRASSGENVQLRFCDGSGARIGLHAHGTPIASNHGIHGNAIRPLEFYGSRTNQDSDEAPAGHVIYFAPRNEDSVGVLDTTTSTFSTISTTSAGVMNRGRGSRRL